MVQKTPVIHQHCCYGEFSWKSTLLQQFLFFFSHHSVYFIICLFLLLDLSLAQRSLYLKRVLKAISILKHIQIAKGFYFWLFE